MSTPPSGGSSFTWFALFEGKLSPVPFGQGGSVEVVVARQVGGEVGDSRSLVQRAPCGYPLVILLLSDYICFLRNYLEKYRLIAF